MQLSWGQARHLVKARRTRTLWERRLAAFVAVLSLLVWPAAFWHEVTTVHEVCPEHGEILDVSGVFVAPSAGAELGPRWTATKARGEQHTVCAFVTLAQPSSPAPAARDAGVFLVEAPAIAPHASGTRQLSVPLLCLAPKHSPPALA